MHFHLTPPLPFLLTLTLTLLLRPALSAKKYHHPFPIDFAARNLKTVSSIYNLTVYPANTPILAQGGAAVPPGLFSANASGRVSPVGNFSGFEDSIEYFFALALTPTPPLGLVFSKAEVVEFTSGCPEVAASVVYLTASTYNTTTNTSIKAVSTLKEVAFWRFDNEGAVLQYEAWIPNLQAWNTVIAGANLSDRFVQVAAIGQLCQGIQARCVGSNQQYASVNDCVTFLSGRNFGSYDEAWADNVVCRTIHVILTQVRPAVHCPHVGPTGGMKCVDEPYNAGYFDDVELYGGTSTFMCPRKVW